MTMEKFLQKERDDWTKFIEADKFQKEMPEAHSCRRHDGIDWDKPPCFRKLVFLRGTIFKLFENFNFSVTYRKAPVTLSMFWSQVATGHRQSSVESVEPGPSVPVIYAF